jgi:hypothetical protein
MDGLATIHQVPFLEDKKFMKALNEGVATAGGDFGNW